MLVKKLKHCLNNKWLVTVLFLGVWLLPSAYLLAQPPGVKASVDRNHILIGEQFLYNVSVTMPDNTYRLSWFNVGDTLGHFRLVKQDKIDSAYSNGIWKFSQRITMTSFDSGSYAVPALPFNFNPLQGDSSFNVFTDSIPIEVAYAPMDSVKTFHDIKSIIAVKKKWPWWWWALAGVAALLLAFWIRFLVRFFRKKNQGDDMFHSRLSPYDEAIQLLWQLQEAHLPEKHEEKEFHFRLNEIFKRYWSRRTGAYKMHLTSEEVLLDLKEYPADRDLLSRFAGSLTMSSAVKFAKYVPPVDENEKCLQATRDLISDLHQKLSKKQENAV